jgi:hypothetical protein
MKKSAAVRESTRQNRCRFLIAIVVTILGLLGLCTRHQRK